jgi:glycosyltransferase involved in cell wall biosynthesis
VRILIIGTRFAPIPPINGGAIESLINKYLVYNSKRKKVEIVVYSALKNKKELKLDEYNNTEFRFIRNTFIYKIKSVIYGTTRKIIKLIFKKEIHDEFINSVYNDLKKKKEIKKYDKIIILNNLNNVLYICERIEGKHILYLHNDYLNKNTKNNYKILSKLDEVWCVSNFIKNRVDEIILNNKTKTIYNGTDIERFNKDISENEINKIKKEYNIEIDDFVILYTGRIMKAKGVKELIKSFIEFSKQIKNTKLLIIGKPVNNNGKYYKEIQEISKNYADKIYFLGYKEHSFFEKIYKIANVQVVPSTSNEAFGLTVVEGLSAKMPMIVSNAGGIPEIVDEKCAIVIDKDKIEKELIVALKRIYNMEESEITYIKENAYKKAKEFSTEKFNKNLEKEMLM